MEIEWTPKIIVEVGDRDFEKLNFLCRGIAEGNQLSKDG